MNPRYSRTVKNDLEGARRTIKFFEHLLRASPDGIVITDTSQNIIVANEAFCSFFETPLKNVIETRLFIWLEKLESDALQRWSDLEKRVDLNGECHDVEFKLTKKPTDRWFNVNASRLEGIAEEESGAIISIWRDITEKRLAEAQLRQTQKMESISRLADGIAHDFNNILHIIVGNTELALEDIPEGEPAHSSLKAIKAASLRAAVIIKQLLNLSRKSDQTLNPTRIIPVIENAFTFLRSMIPTTIEMRRRLPDRDITILADPTQINQVLMNICINASQSMEAAGGILELVVERTTIEKHEIKNYQDLLPGRHVKITISDTGPGIDPETIDRIFDPYFTTRQIGSGSGMGLSIVHGIVKSHSGAIKVDSIPGRGTAFTLLFPSVSEQAVEKIKEPTEVPTGNERILFVDDEESIVTMTRLMLERLGYQVESKMNPVEALALFQADPDKFDLVITDMTMPQMTGVTLAEQLLKLRHDIPVIICTGHNPLIDEERSSALGIAAYAAKPIKMVEIANTIRQVLDEWKKAASPSS